MLEALIAFQESYDVDIVPYLVSSPDPTYVRDVRAYYQFSLQDAQVQARYYGMSVPERRPTGPQINTVLQELHERPKSADWLRYAHHLGDALFRGNVITETYRNVEGLEPNAQLLHQLGNYRGGTAFAHGAWHFGVDRIRRIEREYERLGLGEGMTLQPRPHELPRIEGDTLYFYFSFRSPFSYIALPRVLTLAATHNLKLETLAVFTPEDERRPAPLRMQLALLLDAAREGRSAHVHFGRVNALSREVHEALTAVFYALTDDPERQRRFLHAAMRAVWSRGVDFSQPDAWSRIEAEAKLDPEERIRFSEDRSWLNDARSHGEYLRNEGYLDVPAFRISDTLYWGYDRLTQLEYQLDP